MTASVSRGSKPVMPVGCTIYKRTLVSVMVSVMVSVEVKTVVRLRYRGPDRRLLMAVVYPIDVLKYRIQV